MFNSAFCYFKSYLLFYQAVFQVLYLCLPLIFTVTTGRSLLLFRIQLSFWHVLCKHIIFSLNKIGLCLMELSTLACNSAKSGHLARKEQKRPQLNWCLPRQQNKVCMPCSQHQSSCFTLLLLGTSVLGFLKLMYTHTFLSFCYCERLHWESHEHPDRSAMSNTARR